MTEWRFEIERQNYSRDVLVWGGELFEDGSIAVLNPLVFTKCPPDQVTPDTAFVKLPRAMAEAMLQAMVDACWDYGIRPRAASSEGQAAHLKDMRAIVAKMTGAALT